MSFYTVGDNLRWFIGRVEDIKDPMKLGRVRVRMLNDQTGDFYNKIPTEDLLWAYPISAIQSASLHQIKIKEHEKYPVPDWIDAVGLSPTGIAKSSFVFGFYLDGVEENIPMIFGTYHKMSKSPEPTDPLNADTIPTFNDVSKLAQGGVNGQTLPKEQSESASSNSSTAIAKVIEPESAYKTEYPYNTTYTTKSGHAVEFDDTAGYERIHTWHKSGSYEEISSNKEKEIDGQRVIKTTDNKWEIVIKDNHLLIKGNMDIEIDQNANVHIHGNINMIVDQDVKMHVKGNMDTLVNGNSTHHVKGTYHMHSTGDMVIESDGTTYVDGGGDVHLNKSGPKSSSVPATLF